MTSLNSSITILYEDVQLLSSKDTKGKPLAEASMVVLAGYLG
jgi:hypothetical protein